MEVGRRAGKGGAYISSQEHYTDRRPRRETVDMLARALADSPDEEQHLVNEARLLCGYAIDTSHQFGSLEELASSIQPLEPPDPMITILNRYEGPLLDRITIRPDVYNGKPIIRGRRLAVEHVLGMLAAGDSTEDVLQGYPWLVRDDIRACLVYARRVVANERVELLILESAA